MDGKEDFPFSQPFDFAISFFKLIATLRASEDEKTQKELNSYRLKRERLWPVIAAFMIHSLAISALALGLIHSEKDTKLLSSDNFCAEIVFHQEAQHNNISHSQPIAHKKAIQKKSQKRAEASLLATPQPLPSSSSGTDDSVPLYNPLPLYPREARRKKIQGVVLIQLSVDQDGAVDKTTILHPRINSLLEEAALTAIRQWKFKPKAKVLEVPIEFKLS